MADDECAQLVLMGRRGDGAGTGREQQDETTKHDCSSTQSRPTQLREWRVNDDEVPVIRTGASGVRRPAGELGALHCREADLGHQVPHELLDDVNGRRSVEQRNRGDARGAQAMITLRAGVFFAGKFDESGPFIPERAQL